VVKLVSDLYRKCTAGLVRIPRLALVFVLQVWSKPVKLHRRRPRPGLRVRFFSSSTIAPLGPFELVANPREKDWSSMNPSSSPSSTSKMSEPPAPSTFTFQATFGNMTDSQLHQTISRFSSATNRPVPRFRCPAHSRSTSPCSPSSPTSFHLCLIHKAYLKITFYKQARPDASLLTHLQNNDPITQIQVVA
jgi:hypothetical protein